MKLSDYVLRKNGVPLGHPKSLQNNLYRSLGAKNFSAFWNFWNPIFGYYLGTKVFKPAKKKITPALALILTFVVCGIIHDLVSIAVGQKITLLFSIWFLIMGIAVVISKRIDYDLSSSHWLIRGALNVSILVACFMIARYLNTSFLLK